LGLGSNSCGPGPWAEFQLRPRAFAFELVFAPVESEPGLPDLRRAMLA
jgi:hypothetical protein